MIKNIIRYLQALKSSSPPLLGRWCNIDKSKNNWKIDMANTDHCGTCSYDAIKDKYKTTAAKTTDINDAKGMK
jgi:hypothetical protein